LADIVHAVWSGITHLFVQSPWPAVILALAVSSALVRSARIAIHSSPHDPVRLFTRADKQILLERAGHRCEHHALIGGRCAARERLEADHVHPHSRGGWTHITNGQILCRSHNRAKSAGIPWNRSLRKLAERRAVYYPAGVNGTVRRRRPARHDEAATDIAGAA
jgi:hypothetical protein